MPRLLRLSTALPSTALLALAGALAAQEDPSLQATLNAKVRPFVQKYCAACHGKDEPEADLHLVRHLQQLPHGEDLAVVIDMRDALRDGEMPPEDEPQPSKAEVAEVVAWAERLLAAAKGGIGPGRVTMRRLSRVEYRNTVRDLLQLPEAFLDEVIRGFPMDDLGYGFDNNGDTLSVSALHVEKYAAAAERIAARALPVEDPLDPPRRVFELEDRKPDEEGARVSEGGVLFTSERVVEVPLRLPRRGRYKLELRSWGQRAGPQLPRLGVDADGRRIAEFVVEAERETPETYSQFVELEGGERRLGVRFLNDYFKPADDRAGRGAEDRNLWVDFLVVIGPLDVPEPTAAQRWLFKGDRGQGSPANRARPLLRRLLQRAWRRPVRGAEVDRLGRMVQAACDDGDSFAQAMQFALQAALVSPHFLFRIEPEDAPSTARRSAPVAELLGHYELASRLAYFVWSSMPDERLLKLAAARRMHDERVLREEVRRMLADPRASALAENFAAQWLELRSLDEVTPDPKRFPTWSSGLRAAMRRESELFFRAVLDEGRDVLELLDADFTFVNEVLARHYGIEGVRGPEFRRVELTDRRRGGVVGHASVQTVTSNPTRTSPVKRGKWLLENILDDPPPPPPPGFDAFPEGTDIEAAATLRAQMALHRKQAMCASCHRRMDALGLAMENYDAIGRWRDKDRDVPIDASGELPGGETIDGALALKRILGRGHAFKRCLAKKLFVYGLGRDVRGRDEVVIDELVRGLPEKTTLADMILAIVQLDAFRRRRVGPADGR